MRAQRALAGHALTVSQHGEMFRWLALGIFLTALTISGWRRRRACRMAGAIPRTAEPPLLIASRLLVALPLFGGVLTFIVKPGWMAWAALEVPHWVRWVGVALGFLILPVIDWVLRTLGANVSETVLTKKDHQLVTTGPYRWVRHPLYAMGIVLFMSLGLTAANWFILLWALVALVWVRVVIVPGEEAQLVRVFGDAYQRYRQHAGVLWPRLLSSRERRRAG